MIKLIVMLKRRSDLTHEQFLKYWWETRAPMALKLFAAQRKYVQSSQADSQ
jgi:hypothetical protein